ncbi:hypothetical protein KSP40_PGU022125 [Platanthera guangdongensis]|uniref:SAWADEE domain-containing protein n=1 Tax=Platanthera guangdongensis TaxID=2320717 RepID=A0ABR2MAR1_9ASPA
MAATKLDFSELEAMRKDDCSWRPCCISLSSDDPNVGIIVDFGNGDEDLLYNKEDALSRLRFRSTPLQGDECTNIKEGDHVLALQKAQSKSLFVDATIEQAKRVKHSKRVHCRCTFEVKWLNSGLKGEIVTVPSMSIHRFSDRSIDEHPIFSSFVKALSSKNGGGSPSILSFTEESSCEAEFVGILEKQVEEISKLVDGPITSFTNLFIDAKSESFNQAQSTITDFTVGERRSQIFIRLVVRECLWDRCEEKISGRRFLILIGEWAMKKLNAVKVAVGAVMVGAAVAGVAEADGMTEGVALEEEGLRITFLYNYRIIVDRILPLFIALSQER